MSFSRSLLALVAGSLLLSPASAEVSVERTETGAAITIDGKPFTTYHKRAGQQPALYPLIGPTGQSVTRAYPFSQPADGGSKDHPHHQSFWLNHGDVNGIDFWATNRSTAKNDGPRIVHREFVETSSGEVGKIATRNEWMNGDQQVCEDERAFTFGTGPGDSRWIDFTLTIKAPSRNVTFGDTKEGSFALRVADSICVDAKQGGRILSSEGKTDGQAWAQPARWVDYSGPVKDDIVGITMMSHPKSFRPVPRWHVRTYGLFAANPFGNKDFRATDQGPVTVKKGDSLTFKYRIWIHQDAPNVEQIEAVFRDFARQ